MTLTYGSYTLTGTVDECIDFIKKFDCSYTVTSSGDSLNILVNTDPMIELNKNNITVVKEGDK